MFPLSRLLGWRVRGSGEDAAELGIPWQQDAWDWGRGIGHIHTPPNRCS